jgi:Zn-dependent protease
MARLEGRIDAPGAASNKIEEKVRFFPMPATVFPNAPSAPVAPQEIHNCPNCSHWLPEGTLACPDCQTLTYGAHLSDLALQAQQMEQQGQWKEARDLWQQALEWLPVETRQAVSIQNHIAQIDQRLKAEDDRKARWTRRLGPFAPIALFLLKAKSYLFLIFKLKFLLSFLVYFGLYWVLFGWKFAFGFLASIFIHEMGHYVTVKRMGLRAELPMFLPGFGAYVRWYGQGVSKENLAKIALAGPVYGLVAAFTCMGIFWATHSMLFLVLAYFGALVNLFNLTPLAFLGLDGAQAVLALSRLQRGLIVATCILFFALSWTGWTGDISTDGNHWIFLIVAACMIWRLFTNDEPEKPSTRSFAWFQGLVILLGAMLVYTLPLLPKGQ